MFPFNSALKSMIVALTLSFAANLMANSPSQEPSGPTIGESVVSAGITSAVFQLVGFHKLIHGILHDSTMDLLAIKNGRTPKYFGDDAGPEMVVSGYAVGAAGILLEYYVYKGVRLFTHAYNQYIKAPLPR